MTFLFSIFPTQKTKTKDWMNKVITLELTEELGLVRFNAHYVLLEA